MKISYLKELMPIIEKVDGQETTIKEVASMCADVIKEGKMVHLFGSGTSTLAIQDVFPRYGGILGFHPLLDKNLLLTDTTGSVGAKELLWLEKKEGYIERFLSNFNLQKGEIMIVYSHDCNNIAQIEAAMYAKNKGLKVIVITSLDCVVHGTKPKHSSKKKVIDFADVVIDNGCPLTDALIELDKYPQKVGASSTVSNIIISQSIVTQTAVLLEEKGHKMYIFASPTIEAVPRDWSDTMFEKYTKLLKENS